MCKQFFCESNDGCLTTGLANPRSGLLRFDLGLGDGNLVTCFKVSGSVDLFLSEKSALQSRL